MGFNLQDYETVEDRLVRFWADHPSGRIWTVLVTQMNDAVMFRAEVYFDAGDPHPKATGYAEEVRGSSPVNKTAHVENCETSAIGRALANCGYATRGKRPSREEMAKAARSHPSGAAPAMAGIVTEKQINYLKALYKKQVGNLEHIDEYVSKVVGVETTVEKLTVDQGRKVIDYMKPQS